MRAVARLLVVALLAGVVVVAPPGRAEAIVVPETLYHERPISTVPVVPGFPIDRLGIVLGVPEGEDTRHLGGGESEPAPPVPVDEPGDAPHIRSDVELGDVPDHAHDHADQDHADQDHADHGLAVDVHDAHDEHDHDLADHDLADHGHSDRGLAVDDHDAHDEHDHDLDGIDGLRVRFRHDGVWGSWQAVTEDGAQAIGAWSSELIAGFDAEAYQIRGIPDWARDARVAAINTTDGPPVVVEHRPAGAADAAVRCRSRKDWGADESLRTSSRSFAPLRVVTVHHTAGPNDDLNPAARVRAIYTYHVRTNGWADIGYHALIAEDGTVFEGRWSGSNSPSCLSGNGTTAPFGHQSSAKSSHIVTGAHVGGWNTGNYGIALLGTFTTRAPKAPAREALVAELAGLARRHGFDPKGSVTLTGTSASRTVKRISGHRDFSATDCPGGSFHAQMPTLRTDVAARNANPPPPVVAITAPDPASHVTVYAPTVAGTDVRFAADLVQGDPDGAKWQWLDRKGKVLARASEFDRTLPAGRHVIRVRVTDRRGKRSTASVVVTVVAELVDDGARWQKTTTGRASGKLAATRVPGGSMVVREVLSKGPRATRTSQLDHRWRIDVRDGPHTQVELVVHAAATSSSDGDDFVISTSTDGGATYVDRVTINAGESGTFVAVLPTDATGRVFVRVTDTDRTPGHRHIDRLTVSYLAIRTTLEIPDVG